MKEQWSSKWVFILAAASAAVGLGNIWKFPYMTGANGGGAFVLLYLGCIVVLGIPLLMCEFVLGRRGQKDPQSAFKALAKAAGKSLHWQWLGLSGILASFLIVSYYFVISGWVLHYSWQAMLGAFDGLSALGVAKLYDDFTRDTLQAMLFQALVIGLTIGVVSRGVQKGLEKASYFMFPAIIFIMLILLIYAIQSHTFMQGMRFLLHPDFSKITSTAAIQALGHAFFSLSIACGTMMMYGAYLPKHVSIAKSAVIISMLDTLVALLAGFVTFPIVFANHLDPANGPSLIFKTLPLAFGHMALGHALGALFFLMLFFAAFTSAISLLEPSIAWLMERSKISRSRATVYMGSASWLVGLATVFSFGIWSEFKLWGFTLFELIDKVTANFMLPLNAFFMLLFVGWLFSKNMLRDELASSTFNSWHFTVRYVAPVIIAMLFMSFIGIF